MTLIDVELIIIWRSTLSSSLYIARLFPMLYFPVENIAHYAYYGKQSTLQPFHLLWFHAIIYVIGWLFPGDNREHPNYHYKQEGIWCYVCALMVYAIVHCSLIASAASPRMHLLQLLLPDCIRFNCCSPIASTCSLSCSGSFQPMPNVLEHSSWSRRLRKLKYKGCASLV